MLWFTGDFHLGHANILNIHNLPFKDIFEYNETILNNFNSKVSKRDTTYILGDFSLNKRWLTEYLNRMNGNKIFIMGNHDLRYRSTISEYALSVHDILDIVIKEGNEKYFISLCHYPMISWNKSCHGSWQLHAHCHGTLPKSLRLQYDVGIHCNELFPVSFDKIKKIFKEKVENKNKIYNQIHNDDVCY